MSSATSTPPSTLGEDLKFILPLIYIIPSFIIYFIVLHLIFLGKNKSKFSGSFYKIFGCSAINYMIHATIYYFVLRVPTTPSFLPFVRTWPKRGPLLVAMFMILYYSAMANHLYSVLMSFNRFTVFILKIRYKPFWQKYVKWFILVCVLSPFLGVWQFILTDIVIEPDFDDQPNGTVHLTRFNKDVVPWMNHASILFYELCITASFSLFMNVVVVIYLIKQKYFHTAQSQAVSSQDIKMFIYSVLVFSTEVISIIQQVGV